MNSATVSTNLRKMHLEQVSYGIGTVVTFVALIVGIISNIVFLSILMVCTGRKSRLRLFLIHLVVANLFVCCFTIAFELGWRLTVSWIAGDFFCRILSLTKTLGLYAESYVVVAMAVDHYYTVIWPKHTKSQSQRAKIILGMAWSAATVFSIPQAIVFHEEENPNAGNLKQCVTLNSFDTVKAETVYFTFGLLAMYGFPLVVIIFFNTLLLCQIRAGRAKNLPRLKTPPRKRKRIHSNPANPANSENPANSGEPDCEPEYSNVSKVATAISMEEYSEESDPSFTNPPSQARVRVHTGFQIRHTEMIVQIHARRRAMKLAILMMLTFTLSYSPYAIAIFTLAMMESSLAAKTEAGENVQRLTDGLSIFSLCLSTFINPLMYGIYVCYDNWHWRSVEARLPDNWELQLNDRRRQSSQSRQSKRISMKENGQ